MHMLSLVLLSAALFAASAVGQAGSPTYFGYSQSTTNLYTRRDGSGGGLIGSHYVSLFSDGTSCNIVPDENPGCDFVTNAMAYVSETPLEERLVHSATLRPTT